MALAADGRVVLEPTQGATVQVFPQTAPGRLEWAVYGNVAPLDDQLGGLVEHVLETGAHGVGNGTWLVTAWLSPGVEARGSYHWEGSRLVLDVVLDVPELIQVEASPSLEELLAGTVARWQTPHDLALHPLQGGANTMHTDPRERKIPRVAWSAPGAPIGAEDWPQVDAVREVLTSTRDPVTRAAAHYRLGQLHSTLGFHREANYYYGRAREGGAPLDVIALDQAQTAFAMGRWDEGRTFCEDAHTGGAAEALVLECLAIVSLATGSPAPAGTGRALARASGRPDSLLLAAQLLQVDGRHREAIPLLEAIVESGNPDFQDQANANLGESRFYAGDTKGAREAWRTVTDGDLGTIVWGRQRLLLLMTQGPASWTTEIPDLHDRARDTGPAGADALYLLGQISERLGDSGGAITHYHDLLVRHPTRAAASDVPARQWRMLSARMKHLHDSERRVDLVTLYRDRWLDSLELEVKDPTPLKWVVQAYAELGLPGDALELQRLVFGINTRLERNDPESVLQLAQLYARTEHHSDALETIAWMRQAGIPRELRGPVLLLEGDAHAALDQPEDAMRAWRSAARNRDVRTAATARMALADAEADRCDSAIPALQRLTATPDAPEMVDGRIHLALAMCLDKTGDAKLTAEAAKAAAGRLEDDVSRRYAMWLADKAARESGEEDLVTDAVRTGDDLWAELGRENEAHEAFTNLLDEER